MTISNIAFSKSDAKGVTPRKLRKVRSGMDRDGVIVLNNLFPVGLLQKIRSNILRRHESGELRRHGLVRDIAGRCTSLLPFEGPFLNPRFYANRKLMDIVAALLGTGHCIGSLEVVIAMPGATEQHQHIDGPLRFDQSWGKTNRKFSGDLSRLPPYAVTLAVPLCDVSEENGPTAVWPGSHRTALRPRPPSESRIRREFPEERMVAPFGSAFLFDYRTFHCGLPNFSREPRPLLMFVFTRNWFRDQNLADVSPRVVIAKRDFARIPERHKHLFMLAPAACRSLWR